MGEAESQDRRKRRMERIDRMPSEIRACVHEYGLSVVDAMLDAGVKKAKHIHHIVATVRVGSYQSKKDGVSVRAPDA